MGAVALPVERPREEKNLRLAEIQGLIDQGELHYYVVRPNLVQVGQQLFNWLDGEGCWLRQAIGDHWLFDPRVFVGD